MIITEYNAEEHEELVRAEGHAEGYAEGYAEGLAKGLDRAFCILMEREGRKDELEKAMQDPLLKSQLLKEYNHVDREGIKY